MVWRRASELGGLVRGWGAASSAAQAEATRKSAADSTAPFFPREGGGGGREEELEEEEEGGARLEYTPFSRVRARELLEGFGEVVECRTPAAMRGWHAAAVELSGDRPSFPLITVFSKGEAEVVLTQPDRRLGKQESYLNALGLRCYRCRVHGPTERRPTGLAQNTQDSPFDDLELVAASTARAPTWAPLAKAHSVALDLRLEPRCLYIIAADIQYRCPRLVLRVSCSRAMTFRELSAPEAAHFLEAQAGLGSSAFSSRAEAGPGSWWTGAEDPERDEEGPDEYYDNNGPRSPGYGDEEDEEAENGGWLREAHLIVRRVRVPAGAVGGCSCSKALRCVQNFVVHCAGVPRHRGPLPSP